MSRTDLAERDLYRDVQEFAELYERVGVIAYSLESGEIIVAPPPASARACAICGRSKPQASFRSASHLLPVALRNRRLLSEEECDECNDRYKVDDDALAKMLQTHRILANARGRGKGKFKKVKNRKSYVQPSGNRISVVTHDDDPSVRFELGDDRRTGRLTIALPRHSPYAAVRSILRAAWLSLTPDGRRACCLIGRLLRRDIEAPILYASLTLAGFQFHDVSVETWKLRDALGAHRAPFAIVRLMFAGAVVDVLLAKDPGASARQWEPSQKRPLLPPVPRLPQTVDAHVVFRLAKPGAVDDAEVTLTLAISDLTQGPAAEHALLPQRPTRRVKRRPQAVCGALVFEPSNGHPPSRHEITITVQVDDERGFRAVGCGETVGVRFTLSDGPGVERRVGFTLLPHRHRAGVVKATLEWLDRDLASGGVLRVLGANDSELRRFDLLPSDFGSRWPGLRTWIGDLALVAERTGQDLRVPRNPTPEFHRLVAIAAAGMRGHRVIDKTPARHGVIATVEQVQKIRTMCAQHGGRFQWTTNAPVQVGSTKLDLGSIECSFEGASVIAEQSLDDGRVLLTIQADSVAYRFTNRIPSAEPPTTE